MIVVVTDAGPVLHLQEAGFAHLIPILGKIQTTPTVASELKRHTATEFAENRPEWLEIVEPSNRVKVQARSWVTSGLLDVGEAEALAYARDIKADLFLTDDAAARVAGESLDLEARGFTRCRIGRGSSKSSYEERS